MIKMKLTIANQILKMTTHVGGAEYCYRTLHKELTRMVKDGGCKAYDNSENSPKREPVPKRNKQNKYRVTYQFLDGSMLFRESFSTVRIFPS
jgi:hypothetical protein